MDKSKLIGKRGEMRTAEVEVEGGIVTVRSLTRAEALALREISDPLKFEQYIVSCAMVDPALTKAEVAQWQKNSGALELEDVTDKVMEISGLKERAEKAAYKSAEGE
jgi:hypothetical protein